MVSFMGVPHYNLRAPKQAELRPPVSVSSVANGFGRCSSNVADGDNGDETRMVLAGVGCDGTGAEWGVSRWRGGVGAPTRQSVGGCGSPGVGTFGAICGLCPIFLCPRADGALPVRDGDRPLPDRLRPFRRDDREARGSLSPVRSESRAA